MTNRKAVAQEKRTGAYVLLVVAFCAAVAACLLLAGCSGSSSTKANVGSYSWSELSSISKEISEAETDAEGMEIAESYNLIGSNGKLDGSQTKSVTLKDGTKATVALAGIRQDTKSDGSKAGLTFVFTDAIAARGMNDDYDNTGGWEKSDMRSWLASSDFTGLLPSDLVSAAVAVNKKTNTATEASPSQMATTADKFWLLSVSEVSGSVSANNLPAQCRYPASAYNAEGSQYQMFKNMGVSGGSDASQLIRKCVVDTESGNVMEGDPCLWWLRSMSMNWTAGYANVTDDGNPYDSWPADIDLGVVPGFCV